MNDFSSAAMMRVISCGARRLGMEVAPQRSEGAHVPLDAKRAALAGIARRLGIRALLQLGQGVHDLHEEPLLIALRAARDPRDLMQRWQRLERYSHSRHRIVETAQSASSLCWTHVSLAAGEAPTREEDLVVFGVLIALLELMGLTDLRIRFQADALWQQGRVQEWSDWQPSENLYLSWGKKLIATKSNHHKNGLIANVRERIADDLSRSWSIAALADELGVSTRTLQRKLSESETSFSEILRAVRLVHASRLLTDARATAQAPSTAQIGYLSGYSDQAHFTREMKRSTAMTPMQFRAVVGAGASQRYRK